METQGHKSGFVTLLGKPNVGKSTLLNRLVGQHISITADKPQTTRNRIRGIVTEERYQAVILDTPGIHLPRNELHRRIVDYAVKSTYDSDLILYLTEAFHEHQSEIKADDQLVLKYLSDNSGQIILVINKIDQARDVTLLKTIDAFRRMREFNEIIPVSALTGAGVDTLRDMFFKYLPEGPSYFPDEQVTDTTIREIVGELVREQITRFCFHEVPYGVAVAVDSFKESPKRITIYATITVEKASQKKIIIGKNGSMLKKVGTAARKKIESLLAANVYLSLHVKVSRDWFNNPGKLTELGYEKL